MMIDSLTMKKECLIHLEQQKRFPWDGASSSFVHQSKVKLEMGFYYSTRLLCYASLEYTRLMRCKGRVIYSFGEQPTMDNSRQIEKEKYSNTANISSWITQTKIDFTSCLHAMMFTLLSAIGGHIAEQIFCRGCLFFVLGCINYYVIIRDPPQPSTALMYLLGSVTVSQRSFERPFRPQSKTCTSKPNVFVHFL